MSLRAFLSQHGVWLTFSIVFGGLVGVAELMARYRDEPADALKSKAGWAYISLNGLISAAAYGFLVYYGDKFLAGLSKDGLMSSIFAGFGSMVIMRSKLLSIRTEGGETLAVGPEIVLSTFLKSVDRIIDRRRSFSRQRLVYDSVKTLKNPATGIEFLKISLASYQNLSDPEKKELNDIISDVQAKSHLGPQLKLMAICYGMLNLTGETNFQRLMAQLQEYSEQENSEAHQSLAALSPELPQ